MLPLFKMLAQANLLSWQSKLGGRPAGTHAERIAQLGTVIEIVASQSPGITDEGVWDFIDGVFSDWYTKGEFREAWNMTIEQYA